jgi:hypothetical protein
MKQHDDGNPENCSTSLMNNPNEFYMEQCPECNRPTRTATLEIGYYDKSVQCLECGVKHSVVNEKHKKR